MHKAQLWTRLWDELEHSRNMIEGPQQRHGAEAVAAVESHRCLVVRDHMQVDSLRCTLIRKRNHQV